MKFRLASPNSNFIGSLMVLLIKTADVIRRQLELSCDMKSFSYTTIFGVLLLCIAAIMLHTSSAGDSEGGFGSGFLKSALLRKGRDAFQQQGLNDTSDSLSGTMDFGLNPNGPHKSQAAARNKSKFDEVKEKVDAFMQDAPELNFETLQTFYESSVAEKGILGSLVLSAGVLLCFAGFMMFKVMLGLIGFIGGALIALKVISIDAVRLFLTLDKLKTYMIVIGTGLVAGVMIVWLYKMGTYFVGAVGGYLGTVSLMAIPDVALLMAKIPENLVQYISYLPYVGAGIGVILVAFFNTLIITIISSLIGSLLIVIGVDTFYSMGFVPYLLVFVKDLSDDGKINGDAVFTKESKPQLYNAFVAMGCLLVAGIVVQLISGRRKN